MLHSNPGDYAWGQGGLDAVITQVCETQSCYFTPKIVKKKKKEKMSFCKRLCSVVTGAVGKHRPSSSREREDLFSPNC